MTSPSGPSKEGSIRQGGHGMEGRVLLVVVVGQLGGDRE